MKKNSRVKAIISLDAIAYNFEEMHKRVRKDTQIVAVIKANGYGHGAEAIARMVEGYDYIWGFAVATDEEALQLRGIGVQKPILILGLVFPDYYKELIEQNVRITVSEYSTAAEISALASQLGRTAMIHLALDTGMTRIGFRDCAESVEVIQRIQQLPHIKIEGMFTHFSRADEYDLSPAVVQMNRYQNFADKLQQAGVEIPLLHCSNSAGIMRLPEANMSLVRAGITVYGIYPSNEVERELLPLKPAMELKSHITYVKDVEAEVGISYGATYVTDQKRRVATIPVGYADGFARGLSNKSYVLIHGQKAPILGRICMDQFMVDVTDIPDARRGDEVTLIGRDGEEFISIETLGDISGRFSYEFACEVSPRVPRVYVYQGKEYELSELTF